MKKWLISAVAVLAAIVAAVVAFQVATGLRPSRPVGFQLVQVSDSNGTPLNLAIWYPTESGSRPTLLGLTVQYVATGAPVVGASLPLIVISHGSGGGPGSHADTALALASAGFVVAAPMHTGDNYADQTAVGTPDWLVARSRHVPVVIDYLLTNWPDHARIDTGKIGMFGFSAGAFTALTTIGGTPDLALIARHCSTTAEFACQLWKPAGSEIPLPASFARDPRVKAAVIAAPGYGFTFVPNGLANVTAPVQIWSGALDGNVPTDTNAGPMQAALGAKADLRVVPGAGHFSFLVPCGLIGPPLLCRDAKGFDRKLFHESFNQEIVRFFQARLNRPAPA
jgi:predicted dienelactone hydrolase